MNPSRIRIELPPKPPRADGKIIRLRQKRNPAFKFRKERVEIPIYGRGPYTIDCGRGADGKRVRFMRATFADAKQCADEQATIILNRDQALADFTSTDRASLRRVQEILEPTGVAPELAAAEFASLRFKLASAGLQISPGAVIDDYILNATKRKIVTIRCPALVEEFLEARRKNTFGKYQAGKKCLRTYASHLKFFAEHFDCPLEQVTGAGINQWLKSRGIKGVTKRGYRSTIGALMSYAKAMNYQRLDWNELQLVTVSGDGKPRKAILTPEEMEQLLNKAHSHRRYRCHKAKFPYRRMVPFLALGAFAGIRHEEIKPDADDKSPLDWSDIDFKQKEIHVREETDKNGDERFIPMTDNLVKWLLPHAKSSGPVCEVPNSSNALYRLKALAGIKTGKGESRNALRKSWESYSNALRPAGDGHPSGIIAGEAGHSQAVAKRNYVRRMLSADAARWFSLAPTAKIET